ncbi:MAG: hypothetical protein PHG96_08795, partial [Kiritimatiellae bacterium]|nr:hypothetical protein [Kiritimatiellia bacterium]
MHSEPVVSISPIQILSKISAMFAITALTGWGAHAAGLAPDLLPVVAVCTFIGVICTTLFFWT